MERLGARYWFAFGGLLLACGRNDARAVSAPPSTSAAAATTAASGASRPAAPPRDVAVPAPSGPPFVVGAVQDKSTAKGVALLTDVRAARHEGFNRVVFEFAAEGRPGYHAEYIDKPVRKCGSGDATAIAGDGWLEVRFEPTDAHTPSGAPTIAKREQKLELGVLEELEQTCDFEATVTWVLGVSRPNRFRVLALEQPARVVIDIKH